MRYRHGLREEAKTDQDEEGEEGANATAPKTGKHYLHIDTKAQKHEL